MQEDECEIDVYVFFNPHSHSHLFNKLIIHTTFMYAYTYPLFLVTHSLLHMLTQAMMHTYGTLEPQADVAASSPTVQEIVRNRIGKRDTRKSARRRQRRSRLMIFREHFKM